jgi:hypothetical protein
MTQTQEYHIIMQSYKFWHKSNHDKYLRAEAPQNLRGQTREPSTSHHHRDDLHSPPETLDPPSYQCGSKTASDEGTNNKYIPQTSTLSLGGPWGERSTGSGGILVAGGLL